MNVIIKTLAARDGNLYHNTPNQLRRAIGRYTASFVGGRCGTVVDAQGQSWDWWETAAMADPTFPKIHIQEAR